MSWNLELSFSSTNQLIGIVTPPDNCYCQGGIHLVDINSPYLEGITLEGYQDGDYIAVLVVEYDCNVGNTGTIQYDIDLWENIEGSGYAYVVVYDEKDDTPRRDKKTSTRVLNIL